MEAFACGEIGLDISYFYQLTPREFDNIAKGYRRKLDREERQSWEQTRSIMFTIAMPNLPKTKRNMKITEFMPLPWEKQKKEIPKMSREELNQMFAKWDKLEFKKQEDGQP